MALRKLRYDGDDILLKNSRAVEKFDEKLWTLLDDMKDTMYMYNGVGLAAVQVGMLKRVFVIDVGTGLVEFINPEILEVSKECQTGPEGCLSFPDQFGEVTRPYRVKVRAQDRNGVYFVREETGLFARAISHENDHLNGIVFKARANKMLSEEEMEEY